MFDNFFASLSLLGSLADHGIGETETFNEHRHHDALVTAKKQLEKKKPRYMEEVFSGSITVMKWKDNKTVSDSSNMPRGFPVHKPKRWNKYDTKHIEVEMPHYYDSQS